jgi:VWFA-related protein
MTQRVLLSLLLVILILPHATGQQPTPLPSPATQKPATPQNPPEIDSQDVVRITANLVQVDAVVTKNGKQVTDLKAEDFEVFEDGKPQTITNFSYISNLPESAAVRSSKTNDATAPVPPAKINAADQRRVMAVVIDDLGISFESMTHVRKQVRKLLDDLSPNDLVAIIRTGGDVGSLQQFTNDRRVLQNAVDRLRWNPCSRGGVYVFAPAGSMGSNTGLCSQLIMHSTLKSLRFIIKGMSYLPGRKSLLVLSDYLPIQDEMPSAADETKQMVGDSSVIGSMSESMSRSDSPDPNAGVSYAAQLQLIAELAIRASVVIYSVDTRGLQYTGLTAADRLTATGQAGINNQINSIMRSRSAQLLSGREGSDLIARQTGGFLIRNSNDFGLNQVMNDQQGYYLIGFRPAEETFNRKFHHLKAQVKRGGLSVRTRAGFYGFTDEEARPKDLSVADRMTKALMSPFGAKDITMRLTSFFFDDPSQGPVVRSFVYIDNQYINLY